MSKVILIDLPEALYARLKKSASANRRGVGKEVIAILETEMLPQRISVLDAARSSRVGRSGRRFNHEDVDRLKRQGRA